ncbi:MAG: SusC/RagA family TonB-linked outer membrane protein, partial [Bacteroidales bacterium]
MKNNRYGLRLLLSSFMLLLTVVSYAQTIKGIVTDKADKMSIPGAVVMVKGATIGTATSIDGEYTITIPQESPKVLVFSCVGYKTETVEVKNNTTINIELSEVVSELEEVTVVGYGTMRKSDLTGSLASVKIQEEEAASVTSFDRLMQGKAAGVQVSVGNNAPGGAVSVVIRGNSSFNSASQPLYVVDGVVLNPSTQDVSGLYSGTANNQEAQNPLSAISPQDIVSIEVLKDASATAIYGSQGANGVVLITTKSGSTDKPKIEFSSSLSVSQYIGDLGMLDIGGYTQWKQEVFDTFGSNELLIPSPETQGVDWVGVATRQALSTTNRVSVSGKTQNGKYFVSGGYALNNGIIRKMDSEVSDIRVNISQNVTNWFELGSNSSFAYTNINTLEGTGGTGSLNGSMARQMVLTRPYRAKASEEVQDDNISDGPELWFDHYTDKSKDTRFIPSVYANFKIFSWLSFRSSAGFDFRVKERSRFWGPLLQVGSRDGDNGRAGTSQLRAFSYSFDNMFNYDFELAKGHRLSGVVGLVANSSSNQTVVSVGENFTNSDYGIDGINLSQRPVQSKYRPSDNKLFSTLARAIYNFNDRYTLTASFRADGSSKFAEGNKFAYFPSFALAWRFSEEEFMKNLSFLDNLKIRAGWGQVGNQGLSPYQTLSTYSPVFIADPSNPNAIITGYVPARRPNPD